jgi:hypothetical protein
MVDVFMALLSFRGFDTPSLPAQGEQRRSTYFNIGRDIPGKSLYPLKNKFWRPRPAGGLLPPLGATRAGALWLIHTGYIGNTPIQVRAPIGSRLRLDLAEGCRTSHRVSCQGGAGSQVAASVKTKCS